MKLVFRTMIVCLIFVLSQAATFAAPSQADLVFDTIAERLALMKSVAAWKLANDVAIEDSSRELVVLKNAIARATSAGLDAGVARPFFVAQIEAAKDIQRCWTARWQAGVEQRPENIPDLLTEIRPRLLDMDVALNHLIAEALGNKVVFDQTGSGAFNATVAIDCLSNARRDQVYGSLTALRLEKQ